MNNTGKSLRDEVRRTYVFPNNQKVTIESPVELWISTNGHRVADENNNGHYVPYGWLHLYWETKPGSDAVAF